MPKIQYLCEYCMDAHCDTAGQCIGHERFCDENPINRTCATCKHWKSPNYDRKTFDCKELGVRTRWRRNCDKWEGKP
jgi:hypothetical protein